MVILFILMLIAAFVGTIFAFRAAKRIHDGADFGYEMVVCAVCVTFVVYWSESSTGDRKRKKSVRSI